MVNESSGNMMVITDLMVNQHPDNAEIISKACQNEGIQMVSLEGAKDLWCRDFMPVQIRANRFIQFTFDPSYYKHNDYGHLRTDPNNLKFKPPGVITSSNIVLDGGNISYLNNKAIITDKIFRDNPQFSRKIITSALTVLLELEELIIIPSLPFDITGHSDGMVRFINEDELLVNDVSLLCKKYYMDKLIRPLRRFNIRFLPNDLHKNNWPDDDTGDYINMIVLQNSVLAPTYGTNTDTSALEIISRAFQGHTIIPVPSNKLTRKGGGLHCATWNFLKSEE